MYCNVLVIKPFDHTFTYKIKDDQKVKVGNIVNVPFGKKKDQIGIVYEMCGNEIKKDNLFTIKTNSIFFNLIPLASSGKFL